MKILHIKLSQLKGEKFIFIKLAVKSFLKSFFPLEEFKFYSTKGVSTLGDLAKATSEESNKI